MNGAHLHLILTHLPIVGLGFALLINIYALFKKSNEMEKLSFLTYIIVGIFALAAYLTGEGAEEVMENFPGIEEGTIETHEYYGLLFFIGLAIMGGVAILGLYFQKAKESISKKLLIVLLVAALGMGYLAFETGSTGGEIRHTEMNEK